MAGRHDRARCTPGDGRLLPVPATPQRAGRRVRRPAGAARSGSRRCPAGTARRRRRRFRGTPEPDEVTDADALLALAQDALAAEQAKHPDIARRRRPQPTVQIDPLSGWGRQADGELLPPTSLRAVLKALPGRGGVLRLRPVTAADLRRHDLGRTSREANAALRELLGALDGERCRFPGCTRHNTPTTPTTSATGPTAARPIWTIWCWSAADTTP